jgi:hypothetical protein
MRPWLKVKFYVWNAERSGARWNATKRSTFQLKQRISALTANALFGALPARTDQISFRTSRGFLERPGQTVYPAALARIG